MLKKHFACTQDKNLAFNVVTTSLPRFIVAARIWRLGNGRKGKKGKKDESEEVRDRNRNSLILVLVETDCFKQFVLSNRLSETRSLQTAAL